MQSDIEPLKHRLQAAAAVLLAQVALTERTRHISAEQLRHLAELLAEAADSLT